MEIPTKYSGPSKTCYHCDHDIYPRGKPLIDNDYDNAVKTSDGSWKCTDCVKEDFNKEILRHAPNSPAARNIIAERKRKENFKARYEQVKKMKGGQRLSYYQNEGVKEYR